MYVGRALDNRIGGFMIAQVARLLKENKNKLPFTLYVVNSVREETGLRGAEMMALHQATCGHRDDVTRQQYTYDQQRTWKAIYVPAEVRSDQRSCCT